MEEIVQYLVAAMIAWVPPHRSSHVSETLEEGKARYEQIARDAVKVAYNPEIEPLYAGSYGRARTALDILSVASWESAYSPKVDSGEIRGDVGKSWCFMQINLGQGKMKIKIKKDKYTYWSGADLIKDRSRCFRAGLEKMKRSFSACKGLPFDDLLTSYASGTCISTAGKIKSRQRLRRGRSWMETHPIPMKDEEAQKKYCSFFPKECIGKLSYRTDWKFRINESVFNLLENNTFYPGYYLNDFKNDLVRVNYLLRYNYAF